MAGPLPDGDPAPRDGALPAAALAELRDDAFGVYVHVPFCRRRCGYCAFTTYADEDPDRHARFVEAAVAELRFAAGVLGAAPRPVSVFLGGGTPTLLPTSALARIIATVADLWGPSPEVTVEANPDTVDAGRLERLAAAGVTRLSVGMQSLRPGVLRLLDREHEPERPLHCVEWAHRAGIRHVNLDLIMGTPGETDADLADTVSAVIEAGPDHVAAYGLMVEPGTRLAARVRHGELATPDDDVIADRWWDTHHRLEAAGFTNYEVSNWAAAPEARCRHNLLYWRGEHWWGVGPGAHSHIGGVRWWNTTDPDRYARRLLAGRSPAVGRETLTTKQRRLERVMTGLRLAEGVALRMLDGAPATRVGALRDRGLMQPHGFALGRLALNARGRLLAEAVAAELL